jgi:predicted enzyme related to lactoylglutathione lyase
MPSIVHFDIPSDDMERAKRFYEGLLGWKFAQMPGIPMQYLLIETKDAKGKKGVAGGLGPRGQHRQITDYFDVKSLDESIAMVKKLGGKVSAKMPVPGVGWLADCTDTEGNAFGLFQDDKSAK